MAHYALLDENNIVVSIITGVHENIIQTDSDGIEVGGTSEAWEIFYQNQPWHEGLTCKRTSYNAYHGDIFDPDTRVITGSNAFRKNFAQKGFTYSEPLNAFIPSKPYNSWVLNEEICDWEAPVAKPSEGITYWDEGTLAWVEIE